MSDRIKAAQPTSPTRECSNPPAHDIEWEASDKHNGAHLLSVTARRWIVARDMAVLELRAAGRKNYRGEDYEPAQVLVVPVGVGV